MPSLREKRFRCEWSQLVPTSLSKFLDADINTSKFSKCLVYMLYIETDKRH